MKRLAPILVWSAISAAFIGPGTVTTAAAAGAGFGYSLLWALVFSTIACLSLQEASGRLTVVSGLTLGEAMTRHFGRGVPLFVVAAIVLGCLAYEAGNILGAVAGAGLGLSWSKELLTASTGVLAAVMLWSGSPIRVARVLGVVVALMGLAFLFSALSMRPEIGVVLKGAVVPKMPVGSASLVLGLVGTTVVPYNLFLGSGLARGQSLGDIRLGLGIAVPLGGVVSCAILITGTAIDGEFSYPALSAALGDRLGVFSAYLFAFGLFAAGLSSAVTAPLAAALSVRGVVKTRSSAWSDKSRRFRGVWLAVLAAGLLLGLTDIKPVPAIILAQALNGIILPLVAVFLLIATNDRELMGASGMNGPLANALNSIASLVAILLGVSAIIRALFSATGSDPPGQGVVLAIAGIVAAGLAVPIARQILRRRRAR